MGPGGPRGAGGGLPLGAGRDGRRRSRRASTTTSRSSRARPGRRCAATAATAAAARSAPATAASAWLFRTARGIFSTPVIGGDGTVYVGSADHYFYALRPDGRARWKLRTGGIIDAAAAIGAYDRSPQDVPDHDRLRRRAPLPPARRRPPPAARAAGDLALPGDRGRRPPASWSTGGRGTRRSAPTATIYAGNTGGGAYAIRPRRHPALGLPGRQLGLDDAGVRPRRDHLLGLGRPPRLRARRRRAASLEPHRRRLRHLLAGDRQRRHRLRRRLRPPAPRARPRHRRRPLELPDRRAHLRLPGARAGLRRAAPRRSTSAPPTARSTRCRPDGSLIWRYDTGDPIRSSPVVGSAPNGTGEIVYVGSSNGKLYAIDAATGERRWSFDTTPGDAALRDRNDLNGSPALGAAASTSAASTGVPRLRPLRLLPAPPRLAAATAAPARSSATRSTASSRHPRRDTTERRPERSVPAATVIGTRLIVRRGGDDRNAAKMAARRLRRARPRRARRSASTTQLSGDGHFLFIRPDGFLTPRTPLPGRGSPADWAAGAGRRAGFDTTMRFRTDGRGRRRCRCAVGARPGRRADHQPPGAAAAAAAAERQPDRLRQLRPDRRHAAQDPAGPRRGGADPDVGGGRARGRRRTRWPTRAATSPSRSRARYRGDQVLLNASEVNLQFSFGPVPLRSLDFRGALGRRRALRAGRQPLRPGDLRRRSPTTPSTSTSPGSATRPTRSPPAGPSSATATAAARANRRPAGRASAALTPARADRDRRRRGDRDAARSPPAPATRPPPPRLDPARRRRDRPPGQPRLPRP